MELLAVLQGGKSETVFEYIGKIIRVRKADKSRNRSNIQTGVAQQRFGVVQPQLIDIIADTHAVIRLKGMADGGTAAVEAAAKVINGYLGGVIGVDIMKHFIIKIIFLCLKIRMAQIVEFQHMAERVQQAVCQSFGRNTAVERVIASVNGFFGKIELFTYSSPRGAGFFVVDTVPAHTDKSAFLSLYHIRIHIFINARVAHAKKRAAFCLFAYFFLIGNANLP